MEPLPSSEDDLLEQSSSLGLFGPNPALHKPRAKLLNFIHCSKSIGRSINHVSIVVIGTAGVGKKATINHFFGFQDKDTHLMSETTAIQECIVSCSVPHYEAKELSLRIICVSEMHDSCNRMCMKQFFRTHPTLSRHPNLIFLVLKATENPILAENSDLVKLLRMVKEIDLVDRENLNVLAVLTHACAIPFWRVERWKERTDSMKSAIRKVIFDILGVTVPVLLLENRYGEDDYELSICGDNTCLPNGELQPKHLYDACVRVFLKNNDLLALITLNSVLSRTTQRIIRAGHMTETNNETKSSLKGNALSVNEEQRVFQGESSKLWKWEKRSQIHRGKFIKLQDYGRDHPQEIKEINGVRVCFSNDFRIGKGSDATRVYIGLCKDGYERAVKRLPKDDCTSLAEQEKKILNEPNTIDSNHIVKYRYLDEESDKDWLFLVMDLCEETLEDFIQGSSADGWSEIARDIVEEVLMGLADLHRGPNPVLHRDLKPSNILRNVNQKWLLADFGISRILPRDLNTVHTQASGTKDWMAVESCSSNGECYDGKGRYKKESDIQVAGMVAFYTLTKGEHPFGEEPDRHRNILNGNPVYLSKLNDSVARDMISWMLSHDPKDRPSAVQVLKHPYLQSGKERFELLCKVGNEVEIKKADTSSDVVRQLNGNSRGWKAQMRADVLKYLITDPSTGKEFRYKSSWTELLRLIRNVNQHWRDRPRPMPQPEAFYLVGDPQAYFLQIFPDLPSDVHKIVRSSEWKERPTLKKYFCNGESF